MTADDIARKVASRAGLDEGQIDSSGEAYDFVQQNNETDWQFLWRLARRIDFEVVVNGTELSFRQAGSDAGDPLELTWATTCWSSGRASRACSRSTRWSCARGIHPPRT